VSPEQKRVFKTQETISATGVADVIAQTLGVMSPSGKQFDTANPTVNSPFDRPAANLIIAVPSLGQELIVEHHLTGLSDLSSREGNVAATLTNLPYPASTLAVETTLSTAQPPSKHGIISASWPNNKGEEVYAFLDTSASNRVASLADVISQTFNGESLTVSMSGSTQQALAFCQNDALKYSESLMHDNSYCIGHSRGGFNVIERTANIQQLRTSRMSTLKSLEASSETLLAELSHSTLLPLNAKGGVSASYEPATEDHASRVTVTYTSTYNHHQTVVYDLSNVEQALLFEELLYVDKLHTLLTTDTPFTPLVQDNALDYFAFSFSSLAGLVEKYGRLSPEFIAALHLIDYAIPKLIKRYTDVYEGRLMCEVFLLGSHPSTRHSASVDTRPLFTQLDRLFPDKKGLTSYYPSLYIEGSTSRLSNLCQFLSNELNRLSFEVYCPSISRHTMGSADLSSNKEANVFLALNNFQLMSTDASTNTTTPAYDSTVIHFQITLWLSIGFVIITIFIIYALAFMNFKKDTLLYSTFNPNWEERKRR